MLSVVLYGTLKLRSPIIIGCWSQSCGQEYNKMRYLILTVNTPDYITISDWRSRVLKKLESVKLVIIMSVKGIRNIAYFPPDFMFSKSSSSFTTWRALSVCAGFWCTRNRVPFSDVAVIATISKLPFRKIWRFKIL